MAATFPSHMSPLYEAGRKPVRPARLPPIPGTGRGLGFRLQPGSRPRLPHSADHHPFVLERGQPQSVWEFLGNQPCSLAELQQSVAIVGANIAPPGWAWRSRFGLVSKAFAVNLGTHSSHRENRPISVCEDTQRDLPSVVQPDDERTQSVGKLPDLQPGTGEWAVQALAKCKLLGKTKFYYLKVQQNQEFRPYDLVVVPKEKVDAEHFVFSTFGVLSVCPSQESQVMSLGEWQREAMVWRALRHIPFFKNYLLRKAFTQWYRNTKQQSLQRRCNTLWTCLLPATPHFGAALLHISRLIQELWLVKWFPLDMTEPLTLAQFEHLHQRHLSEGRRILEKFFTFCSHILQLVHMDSYQMVEDSKKQLWLTEDNLPRASVHTARLQQEQAERWLQDARQTTESLGRLSSLVTHMAVENLISVVQSELDSFVRAMLQRRNPGQTALLKVMLKFDEARRFAIHPCRTELLEKMSWVLRSVGESILEVTEGLQDANSPQLEEPETRTTERESAGSTKNECGCGLCRTCEKQHAGGFRATVTRFGDTTKPLGSKHFCSLPTKLVLRCDQDDRGLHVSGEPLRHHLYPLSSSLLSAILSSDLGLTRALKTQQQLIKDSLKETLKFRICKIWLLETLQAIREWDMTAVEQMYSWRPEQFQELIARLRRWEGRARRVGPMLVCKNHLLVLDCTCVQHEMVPALVSMLQQILQVLKDKVDCLLSQLTTDLSTAIVCLQEKPDDTITFGSFISTLDNYNRTTPDYRRQLDYVLGLVQIVRVEFQHHTSYQDKEEEQVEYLWNTFLQVCREASEFVRGRRDSALDNVEQRQQLLTAQAQSINCAVNAASFQEPRQNPAATLRQLQEMQWQLHSLAQDLQQLSHTQKAIKGQPLDLSFVSKLEITVNTRRELWDLFYTASQEVKDWRKTLLSQFKLQQVRTELDGWVSIAERLRASVPSDDSILLAFDEVVSEFKRFLPVLADMSQPEIKERHWKSIFTEMGETWHTEWDMTISDLLAYDLPAYSEFIRQVLAKARKEFKRHKQLLSVKRFWQSCQFRLVTHIAMVHVVEPGPSGTQRPRGRKLQSPKVSWTAKDSGTLILIEIERLQWYVEDSMMSLSMIVSSSVPADVQDEARKLMEAIEHFGNLLELWKNFQDKWVFLHRILSEMEMKFRTPDRVMMSNIKEVDALYRRVISALSANPSIQLVLNGQDTLKFECMTLREIFNAGITAMEQITVQMSNLLESARRDFPRLHFLSDDELFSLFILEPDPRKLLPFVQKCFTDVQDLQCEATGDATVQLVMPQVNVLAVYGQWRERLELLAPLRPGHTVVSWFQRLELGVQQSLFRALEACVREGMASATDTNRTVLQTTDKSNAYKAVQLMEQVTKMALSYPEQCILITENLCWQWEVKKVLFAHSATRAWLSALYRAKVDRLALVIRRFCKSMTQKAEELRLLSLLGNLTVTIIYHRDLSHHLIASNTDSETSFQWQKLLKYRVGLGWLFPKREATNPSANPFDPSSLEPPRKLFGLRCYVDILSTSLYYDYEYLGSGRQFVHTPLTDRTCLALLLAIQNFSACALVGPCGTGKSATLSQLARALGCQLVTLRCGEGMSSNLLAQLLRGAVQSGAWLQLKDTELLTPGALSTLGQQLITIQDSYRQLTTTYNSWKQDTLSSQQQPRNSLTDVPEREGAPLGLRRTTSSEDLRLLDPTALGSILFKGRVIPARINYAVFTSFPAFDSSTPLPENLRIALRPVSVVRPDILVIIEVKLLTLGFLNPANLARKIGLFFKLARDSSLFGDYCCLSAVEVVVQASAKIVYRILRAAPSTLAGDTSKGPAEGSRVMPAQSDRAGQSVAGDVEGDQERGKPSPAAQFESIRELEESSVLRALLSTFSSSTASPELRQDLQDVLRDLFPRAQTSVPQQEHSPMLLDAIRQSLLDTGHEVTEEAVSNTLALSQALRNSRGVILFGPAGSGKTTSYRVLSQALNRLSRADLGQTAGSGGDGLMGSPVSVTVYFPNSLSSAQLLGSLQKRAWIKGALSRKLSETDRWVRDRTHSKDFRSLQVKPFSRPEPLQWVVLDGEMCLDWLLPVSGLLAQENRLTLPSGERLPLPDPTSLILETCELSSASPATLTRCSLVHFQGNGGWQAVYSRMLNSVYSQYMVHRRTLALWRDLALDLLPKTLQFLQHCSLALGPRHGCPALRQQTQAYGLPEIGAFNRILDSLLQKHLARDRQKVPVEHGAIPPGGTLAIPPHQHQRVHLDDEIQPRDHVLSASIFAVAYIWGFGGHLHSSHRLQFDTFARQALESSLYPVSIPKPGLVFDYYINSISGCLETLYRDPEEVTWRTKIPYYILVPELETYLKLLELLTSLGHSIFLVGEPLSGKTSFVQALNGLGSLPQVYRMPIRTSTQPRDVWQYVADRVFLRNGQSSSLPLNAKGFLFFLDDVHLAPQKQGSRCQPVSEALRHSLTCHGTYCGDWLRFRSLHSTRVSYIATCSPRHGPWGSVWARLTRLMVVLALPAPTWGMLSTIYRPGVLSWLKSFPTSTISGHDLFAKRLLYATIDLYQKVRRTFLPSPSHPHYLFSLADISKVLQGLWLMDPSSISPRTEGKLSNSESEASHAPLAVTKTVVSLWLHESMRTFSDCLVSEEDRDALSIALHRVAHTHFFTHSIEFLFDQSLLRMAVEPQTWANPPDPLDQHQANCPAALQIQDAAEEGETSPGEHINRQEPNSHLMDSQHRMGLNLAALSTETVLTHEVPVNETFSSLGFGDQTPCSKSSVPQVISATQSTNLSPSPSHSEARAQRGNHRQSTSIKPLLPLHLLHTRESLRDLIFSKAAIRPENRQQMNSPQWNPYREVTHEHLAQQLRQMVQRQNQKFRANQQIIFYKEAVCHLAHISRALSLPGSHCALMAPTHCTGRKTLLRLAAYLHMATVFELDGQMSSSEVAGVCQRASRHAGLQGRCTVIVVHDSVGQDTLQNVLDVAAEGWFPGLYSPSELTRVAEQFTSSRKLPWSKKQEQVLEKYFQAVRQCLHIVLLQPVGAHRLASRAGRGPVRLSHLLGSCGYIDVWQPWSEQALTDIATSHMGFGNLSTLTRSIGPLLVQIGTLLPIITKIMALIHQLALSYANHLAPSLPLITPRHYLDFINLFLMIFHHLEQSEGSQIERMELGLDKIEEVYNMAEEHRKQIEHFKQQLQLTAQEQRLLQEHYAQLRSDFMLTLQKNREEEIRLSLLQQELEAARQAFAKEHGTGKSLYETALEALRALSSSDLDEVRTYRVPPRSVVAVMNTVCMMFGRPNGWESAKQLLSQPTFYQDLEFYDKENIPDHIFRTLESVVLRPELQPAAVREASRAVESFSLWIRAIYYHAAVVREYSPVFINQFQTLIDEAQAALGVLRKRAFEMKTALVDLLRKDGEKYLAGIESLTDIGEEHLLRLLGQKEMELVGRLKEQQWQTQVELMECQRELERSDRLIQALYPHQSDWKEVLQQCRDCRTTVSGDSLLTAAAVVYLGPFTEKTRQELLEKWKVACYSGRMETEHRDARMELLGTLAEGSPSSRAAGEEPTGTPATFIPSRKSFLLLDTLSSLREQLEWNQLKLPVNATARISVLIARLQLQYAATPWPLFVDPDLQTGLWMGVLQAGDGPRLDRPVLGDSVASVRSVEVEPEAQDGPGDVLMDGRAVGSGDIDWAPELIQEEPPNNLWVCSITSESLERLLLTAAFNGIGVLVTNVELCPFPPILRAFLAVSRWQVAVDGWNLTFGTLRVRVKPTFRLYLSTSLPLQSIESEMDPAMLKLVRVIDLTISPSGLQELFLKEVLYFERARVEDLSLTRQMDIMYLRHQLQVTQEELMDKVIETATSLLNNPTIHEEALRSQRAKMEIHSKLNALDKADNPSAAMDNPYVLISNIGSEMYWALVHISHLSAFYYFSKAGFMNVVRAALSSRRLSAPHHPPATGSCKERYMDLMDYLISRIYSHFRCCMFTSHARLYRFLVVIGYMKVFNTVTPVEWELFLRGTQDLELGDRILYCPHSRPTWISEEVWSSCAVLELLPAFGSLRDSLVRQGSQWQEYFRLPCTVIGTVPCTNFGHLNTFQKAILWRLFKPNTLSLVVEQVVTSILGGALHRNQWMTVPPLSTYSKQMVPIMFLMPQDNSVNLSTHPLYWIRQAATERHMQNKVRIISLGSNDQTEEILREMRVAMSKGHWLVLNNCHLLRHWDQRLITNFTHIVTAFEVIKVAGPSAPRGGDTCEESGKAVPTMVTESGERIHSDFRLWFTCRNETDCSVPGVIRRYTGKLVIETPSTLRSTLICAHTQAQSEQRERKHSEAMSLLVVLHAVLLHRQHYSLWTQARSYRWTQADLFAALDIQRKLQATWGNSEILLEHLVELAVYSGHLLDTGDEEALRSVINHCLRTSGQTGSSKGICSLISHLGSSTGELTRADIEQMPNRLETAAVGIGDGFKRRLLEERAADISRIIDQSQAPVASGGVGTGTSRIGACLSRLLRLCVPAGATRETGNTEPLRRFLLREWRCLQMRICRSVCALCCALEELEGARVCSAGTQQLYEALEEGCVPRSWWPGARTRAPLPLWLRSVESAVRLLHEYLYGPVPAAYNLSAFCRPRAFLFSILQRRAREEQRALDAYRVRAQVLSIFLPPTSPPGNGVYITGLQLHGALWDNRLGLLQDTLSDKPCNMPVVLFTAEIATGTSGSPSPHPQYECPVYLGVESEAVDLTDNNLITYLSLGSKMDVLVCAQRRVHIVSIL
ncbi:dynein heavy chain domain-containing protein 1 [Mobula hypostoma]|uniref:dynein heavy chain domain-containing protein 1 n=1 Tax=Mobula hypostoma TaxID=723540 RepID=UPI002FC342B6